MYVLASTGYLLTSITINTITTTATVCVCTAVKYIVMWFKPSNEKKATANNGFEQMSAILDSDD